MHDEFRRYRRFGRTGRSTVERVETYLRSRSAEHWAFFIAGFVLAAILT